jgi:hypothetical protein
MTTNQTIDGVPREWREALQHLLDNHVDGEGAGEVIVQREDFNELRALLDAPSKCEMCDGSGRFGMGLCRCYDMPAAQPQGEPIIPGSVLDSYDYAIADLDPESACPYVSNGELSELVAAVRTLQARYLTQPKDEPDPILCGFYEVTDYPGLVRELVGHVAQLQESAKRNVKPWEDTFPATLLPAHIKRVEAANAALQLQVEPSHWADAAGNTVTADLKAYNLKAGGAPAAACAAYSIPLYRQAHPARCGCEVRS